MSPNSIENVGCEDGIDDLTEAQLQSNVKLVKRLVSTYATIQEVIGHFGYGRYRHSALGLELNKKYFNVKQDPSASFMRRLRYKLRVAGVTNKL